MKINLSNRCIARIVTFFLAIAGTLTACLIISKKRADALELRLQANYLTAIEALANSTDNINTTLTKGLYAGSPDMLAQLSSKLWHDSSIAKAALSQIPMGETRLEKTYKFLSQVGNYSLSIAEKAAAGEGLSLEEYTNLASLSDFSTQLKNEIWEFETEVQTGKISISDIYSEQKAVSTENSPDIFEGFVSMEEGFESYPTLIYDGPFSDHILERDPLMLKGMLSVTPKDALIIASEASGIPSENLINANDESGKMPSYCFEGNDATVSITKNGGLVCYMLKSRSVDETKLNINDALSTANAYLIKLGIKDMITTYYETYGNICTINFASTINNVTIYTDLIKVSVALDNGEITGYDARGYIMNHTQRASLTPGITAEEAEKTLSPLLSVNKSKLCIIPSTGENEVLCYEYNCTSRNDTDVLVYVNASTGKEEQILLVYKSDNGVLTI